MKTKIILTTLLNSLTISSFAQEGHQESKWGIGMQINSIENTAQYDKTMLFDNVYSTSVYEWKNKSSSIGITGTRCLNEYSYLRFALVLNNINFYQYGDTRTHQGVPGPGYSLGNTSIKQMRYYFSPQIGWKITNNKFELTGGFSTPLSFSKEYNIESTENHYNMNNNIDYSYKSHRIAPGGFSMGIGAFAGFNYYFKKYLSIGAEASSTYSYYKQGGIITTVIENTIPTAPTTSSSYLYSVKGFDYSGQKLSINIIYFF